MHLSFCKTDGHHLWETEAKVDKDSIKSVSAPYQHDLFEMLVPSSVPPSRETFSPFPLSVSSSSVPCNDVTFAKLLQIAT